MRRTLLALAGWMAAALMPVDAATHVLLTGVTRYDHLPPEKHLRAPGNDVARMRAALLQWGVPENAITVLADDVAGAKARPTHANITAELNRLGRPGAVAAGDWVVLYFSGHGATATDTAGVQMSGLNSVFLPADAMVEANGSPPKNGMIDVKIGEALARIRAQGAHVWFINDSCHSGDSVRAEQRDDVREKSTMPPAKRAAQGKRPPALASALPATNTAPTGRLVAFYAAQVTEAAREFNDDGTWVSAFTLALTSAMAQTDARDARSLASRTMLGVRVLRPRGIFQTPYADDDLADGLVLLGNAAGMGTAHTTEGVDTTLHAGALEGFETGAELSIFASASSETSVATARVTQGGLSRSTISLTSGVLPGGGWFARLTAPAKEARLTIAADPALPPAIATIATAVINEAATPAIGLRTAPVETADVILTGDGDSLRIVPRKALLGVVEAIPFAARTSDANARKAMVTALLRLDFLRRMERAEVMAAAVPGSVRMQMRSSFKRFSGKTAAPCAAPPPAATAETVTAATQLARCDAIEVEIRNHADKPRHVQVLAIHADGTIQTIAPRCGVRASLKLEPGQATAGRQRASAESALPIVWFMLPKPRLPGVGRMAVQVLGFSLDAASTAPDPCQFERFNGQTPSATRSELQFDDETRSGTRPGETLIHTRVLDWATGP